MPAPGNYELVLTPTKVLTEGTGSSHAPYIVASDLASGQSVIAWSDADDASYGKCDAGRSSRGNYPLWSDADGGIDPAWVTAIGVRFRAKSADVTYFAVQLFGQVSKLLSNPFHGGSAPHTFAAVDTWEDFDYVVPDADYDETGWAPDGVQSALEQTFVYCRTVPVDSTGEFTASGVVQISEQSIVVYYTVPEAGLPCDEWVTPPLSTAVFTGLGDAGGPFGQYGDGVIYSANFPGFPDFHLGIDVDETKPCLVTVAFAPDSPHDSGGRGFSITGVKPGQEDDPNTISGFPIGDLYDASDNTADTLTVTIGPGINGWDDPDFGVTAGFTRLWFETDRDGAVSQISIMKICTDDGPTPPSDGGGDDGPNPGGGSGGPTGPVAPGDAPDLAIGFLNPSNRRGAPTEAEIIVDGHWLSLNGEWGGLTWSHTWPGGSANATWSAYGIPHRLTRRDLSVELRYGGQRRWAGVLDLPGGDGTMNAIGLATLGANYAAIDGSGDATTIPDDAIDAAIARGLRWHRRDSFSTDAQDVDITQGPVKLSDLLDTAATDAGQRWAVDPDGYVYTAADPTVPVAHILYVDGPLTPADDQVATALIGRYRDSGGYATTDPVVAPSAAWLGYSEDTIDLTSRGVITEAKAIAKLTQLLNLGRALPAWADPIQLVQGDLLSVGQVPMALEVFSAGQVVRVHGQFDDTQQLGGRTWVDVLIGQSENADQGLTLTPIGAPVVGMFDAITQALNGRKAA